MICSKCGNNVDDGIEICPSCGANLKGLQQSVNNQTAKKPSVVPKLIVVLLVVVFIIGVIISAKNYIDRINYPDRIETKEKRFNVNDE